MKVYAVSFKEKGRKVHPDSFIPNVSNKPHVILILAEDGVEAGEIARRTAKDYDADLRTLKWAGSSVPLLQGEKDSVIAFNGDIETA